MSADGYIAKVLNNYLMPRGPGSSALYTLGVVTPVLKLWRNKYLNGVWPSGSFAKGTGVAGTTDIDVFLSLKYETAETLREIYESLYKRAEQEFWFPQRQNVSIGITWLGTKVDLVPGRRQEGFWTTDHSLWKNKQTAWQQTNVATHIRTVIDSGRVHEIRALKIWRKFHNLDFPSFYLELTVIAALRGRRYGNLAANVSTCLEYIRDNLETSRVADPANSANIISDDLTAVEKKTIAIAAAAIRREPIETKRGGRAEIDSLGPLDSAVGDNRLNAIQTEDVQRLKCRLASGARELSQAFQQ